MRLVVVGAAVVGVALGVTAVVLGGADDSPGLQGLGVLIAVASIVFAVRHVRRSRGRPTTRP